LTPDITLIRPLADRAIGREARVAAKRKVVITSAVTRAIHTRSMSPYFPVTPGQIIAEGLAAANAGAAILRLHARNPDDGRLDQSPEGFASFLPQPRQRTNAAHNHDQRRKPVMRIDFWRSNRSIRRRGKQSLVAAAPAAHRPGPATAGRRGRASGRAQARYKLRG